MKEVATKNIAVGSWLDPETQAKTAEKVVAITGSKEVEFALLYQSRAKSRILIN